jgi:hypothetical protein
MVWIYVDNWKGDRHMKETNVKKLSLAKMHLEPTSYAEVVVKQNPDIEAKLDKLCHDLAMCYIYKYQTGIMEVVRKGLEKATVEHNQLGSNMDVPSILLGPLEGNALDILDVQFSISFRELPIHNDDVVLGLRPDVGRGF